MNHLFYFSLVSILLFGTDAVHVATTSRPIIRNPLPIQRRSDVGTATSTTITAIITVYPSQIGTAQTIPASEPVPTGPPYAQCSLGRCLLDNGGTTNGESMESHLTPDTRLLTTEVELKGAKYSPIIGDIILFFSDDVPKLPLAILESSVVRFRTSFTRWISDSRGKHIGFLIVERPTPDPDTRFDSIANNPLLAAIPTGLRSVVNLDLLVPSSTEGCEAQKCIDIIPSADVFYFGPQPTNVACLSNRTDQLPLASSPPNMDPSYVYIVYRGGQTFNYCREWIAGPGGDTPPETASLKSDQIHTLEYNTNGPPVTKTMNFGDLPCPPSDVAHIYKQDDPYFPILAPWYTVLTSVTNQNHTVSHGQCVLAAIRDPPVRAIRVDHVTGRKGRKGGGIQ